MAAYYNEHGYRHEHMQTLRKTDFSKAFFKRRIGISINDEASQVLRQIMHVSRDEQGCLHQHIEQQIKINSAHETGLRVMRGNNKAACSPRRSQPAKQCHIEFNDTLRFMSREEPFGKFYGERNTAEALHLLRKAINKKWAVLHAYQQIKQIRPSACEKKINWRAVDASASRRESMAPIQPWSRLENSARHSKTIVPQAAAAFIKSFMECRP